MHRKAIYKLVDSHGRVLLPKELRAACGIDYGDIVRLGHTGGRVSVEKVNIIELGDTSTEAMECYVRAAIKTLPDEGKLQLIGELTGLLQSKEG